MIPIRVQRKRVKGYRMPPNTISVARPGRWGNPYHVVPCGEKSFSVIYKSDGLELMIAWALPEDMALQLAIDRFEEGVNIEAAIKQLKGKNLSCFCPLDKPCHADVLLKIANE